MIDKNMEAGLLEEMLKQWNILKKALYSGETEELSLEETIKKYTFLKQFDEVVNGSKPQFEIPLSSLGTIYRGVGVNEEIDLTFYQRMIPDLEHAENHNRMNPPGEAFIYLSVMPERKGKSADIEKHYMLKTIEAELRVKAGDFYTLAEFEANSDQKLFDIVGDPKMNLSLNELASMIRKNPIEMHRLIGLYYLVIFNNDEIFKPVHSTDKDIRAREYAPFQLLARYLRSKGYAGIKYRSTVHKGGTNVVIFDVNEVKLIETSMERVNR